MTKLFSFKSLLNDTISEIGKSGIMDIMKIESTVSIREEESSKIIEFSPKAKNSLKIFNKKDSATITNTNPILYQTNDESKDHFYVMQEKSNKQAALFLGMLRKDFFEPGFVSSSEQYLNSQLIENSSETKDWLNRVFIGNLREPDILVKLLHIIANIDYKLIESLGPTIAIAATRHPDPEVQEYSIRAFEKWGNRESLDILKFIKFHEPWLQDYANEVIKDLESELA